MKDFVADPVDDRCRRARFGRIANLGPLGHRELRRVGLPVVVVLTGERRGPLRALLLEFLQDALDAVVLLDRFRRRRTAARARVEAEPLAELAPQERRRPLQRPRRLAPGLLVAERRVVDARVLEIRR